MIDANIPGGGFGKTLDAPEKPDSRNAHFLTSATTGPAWLLPSLASQEDVPALEGHASGLKALPARLYIYIFIYIHIYI